MCLVKGTGLVRTQSMAGDMIGWVPRWVTKHPNFLTSSVQLGKFGRRVGVASPDRGEKRMGEGQGTMGNILVEFARSGLSEF